jgi:hypothetical protein
MPSEPPDGPAGGSIRKLYEADFAAAQSVWVEAFLELMVAMRARFGSDMDSIILLSAIGQQMLADPDLLVRGDAGMERAPARKWRYATNLDALARATGIPRETVRRKINALEADGLVNRLPDQTVVIGPGAAQQLAPLTEATITMLDRIFSGYARLLARQGPATSTRTKGNSDNGTT